MICVRKNTVNDQMLGVFIFALFVFVRDIQGHCCNCFVQYNDRAIKTKDNHEGFEEAYMISDKD
jgi:hypothetical protein